MSMLAVWLILNEPSGFEKSHSRREHPVIRA
jgi:hypothetical protein